jgi:hypothetical protein
MAGWRQADRGQAQAHGQRREDTNLQGPGREVRLPGVYVWADVFSEKPIRYAASLARDSRCNSIN